MMMPMMLVGNEERDDCIDQTASHLAQLLNSTGLYFSYLFLHQQTNTKDIAISHLALLNTARCDDVDDHNNDDDDEDGDCRNYDDGDDD